MFQIQFVAATTLRGQPDYEDAPWTTMQAEYATRQLAEDDLLWHEIEEPAYRYRVVER